MWRNTMAVPPQMFNILLLMISATANGVIHTEGGSFVRETDQPYGSSSDGDYGEETDVIQLMQAPRNPGGQRQLASIMGELSQVRNNEEEEAVPLELLIEAAKQQQRDSILAREREERNAVNYLGASDNRGPNEEEIEELRKFGQKFSELQRNGNDGHPNGVAMIPEYEPQVVEVDELQESGGDSGQKSPVLTPLHHIGLKQVQRGDTGSTSAKKERVEEKPLTAQKKGQSEFVEFVEPAHVKVASNKLKNVEYLEKRVADGGRLHVDHDDSMFGLISASSNVLFIAFITMCCALTVVGVVGGMYYYNHIHSEREDPFDDFTRYSPAGPGKSKRGLANFTSEKGDDALAYRAQLHHYQQTKQKIIGSGDDPLGSPGNGGMNGKCGVAGAIDDDTDKSEDEGELEHNYSVYECPGLAPTGDIEVQNPNFVDNAGGGGSGKHPRVTSPQSPQRHS